MVRDLYLVSDIGIREGARGFLIHLRAAGFSAGYLQALETSLALLAAYAEEHHWPPLPKLTASHLEEYFVHFQSRPLWFGERAKDSGRTTSRSYLQSQHRRLHRFFGWVEARGYTETNPLKLIPRPRPEEPIIPTVSEAEMHRLLRQVNPKVATTKSDKFRAYRDRAIFMLLLDTPARRAELAGLGLADIDLEEKIIRVTGKFGRDRAMPLGNAAAEALWEYLGRRKRVAPSHRAELWVDVRGRGLSEPQWLYLLVKRLGVKAGIPNLHTHRFRHTYAMAALRGGMPEHVLMWSAGWKRIPETYLRTLGLEDAKHFHQQISPADKLGRAGSGVKTNSKGRGRL